MDHVRRDRYAKFYYTLQLLQGYVAEARTARRDLAALAFPQDLTPPERRRYIEVLAKLDGNNVAANSATGMLLAIAEKNGIRPDQRDVRERREALSHFWGACAQPFVMPQQTRFWVEKFEADETRLAHATD